MLARCLSPRPLGSPGLEGPARPAYAALFTGGGSNVARIIREAGTFGIDVHVIARREVPDAGGAGAAAADAARR